MGGEQAWQNIHTLKVSINFTIDNHSAKYVSHPSRNINVQFVMTDRI